MNAMALNLAGYEIGIRKIMIFPHLVISPVVKLYMMRVEMRESVLHMSVSCNGARGTCN